MRRFATAFRLLAAIVTLAGAVVAIVAPSTAGEPASANVRARAMVLAERDDAELRRKAKLAWYGGELTPEFGRRVLAIAEQERLRYPGKMTGAAGPKSITWRNLGPTRATFQVNDGNFIPGTDSGRVVAIVTNPDDAETVYVAAAQGGVWKSTTGGTTWQPITSAVGTLSTGALAIDPFDPRVLYLGLGDPWDGLKVGVVARSIDGGASWSNPPPLSRVINGSTYFAGSTWAILPSPARPGLVLVATDIGLFRSLDGGLTWTPITVGVAGINPIPVTSLAWTGGANLLLASSSGVFFSGDNGATWTAASGFAGPGVSGRISLAAAPSARNIVYALAENGSGDLGDILRSANRGQTFARLNASFAPLTNPNFDASTMADLFYGQGNYDQLVLVSPTDPNVVLFGGAVLLARTTDGGTTFAQVSNWLGRFGLPYVHADFQCGTVDALGRTWVGNDGGVFRSPDGGTTWTSVLNRGLVDHLVYSIGSSPAAPDVVIGGMQDDGTRLREGATSTFNQVVGGDGFGSDVNSADGMRLLASLYFTRIYRSTNGGTSFAPANNGIPTSFAFFTKLVPWLGDPTGNTVYTLTHDTALRTTDYASSWTALGTVGLPAGFSPRNIAAAKSDGGTLALIGFNAVYLSSDGGATWTAGGALPGSAGALSSAWFDTGDPQVLYVTSVSPTAGARRAWRSANGGTSFAAIDGPASGLPFVPINRLVSDAANPSRLYAATFLGAYRSEDAGATWTRAGIGLPFVDTTDVYVSPDGTVVRLATYGRGFWELGAAAAPTIAIAPASLPAGLRGVAYPTQILMASGATAPYVIGVVSGALPPGLALASSGVLQGTPTAVGTYCFSAFAQDSSLVPIRGEREYCIVIAPPDPVFADGFE